MTQLPRFCRNCGAALQPGVRFCESCGKQLAATAEAAEPAPVRASTPPDGEAPAPPRQQEQPADSGSGGLRGLLSRGFLLLVGGILLAYGTQGPVLAFAGTETSGAVTSVKRDPNARIFAESSGNTLDFAVGYSFQVNGVTHSGSTTLFNVYDQARLMGPKGVRVRYLAAYPGYNSLEERDLINLQEIIALGVGLLFIAGGITGAVQLSRR